MMTLFSKGRHPGAVWKKTDFQIHTPRDPQWSGSPHMAGGPSAEEDTRQAWMDTFIQTCVDKGLHAIAITDHHDFCFVEYAQKSIENLPAGTIKPWLFPGIEITCNDAVQCIMLFDSATGWDDWLRVYGGHLNAITKPDRNTATAPQAAQCGKDIAQFIGGVAKDAHLSKCTLILPHANNDGAHKSMMRQGFNKRFQELPFDGVYSDKSFDQLDNSTKRKIWGLDLNWGFRRKGLLPTGDNRDASYKKLGANTCWMRLGEPTTESIRQALLADEARISYETPSLPSQRVLEIRVSSSLCGESFELVINDGFTALIGGRGSGKSAILEYLRFGLGRSAVDTGTDDGAEREREKGLIEQTLADGYVEVILDRDGVVETWKRTYDEREYITVSVEGVEPEPITIATAQERFRARAFYQKQLSTLVRGKNAVDQITGIAAAEFLDARRQIEQDLGAAKREIKTALQETIKYWIAESEHNAAKNSVADLRRRLAAIKKRLEESGLTPENQAILEKAPGYKSTTALFSELDELVESDLSSVQNLEAEFQSLDSSQWTDLIQFDEAQAMKAFIDQAKADVTNKITQIKASLAMIEAKRKELSSTFKRKAEAFETQHSAAIQQQASLQTLIAESQKLNAELQQAEARERKTEAALKLLEKNQEKLVKSRQALHEVLVKKADILKQAAAKVAAVPDSFLRATAGRENQPSDYIAAVQQICENQRIRDLEDKCVSHIESILTTDVENGWSAICDKMLEVYRHKIHNGENMEPGEHTITTIKESFAFAGSELTSAQLTGIYAKIDDTKISNMLTATPEDFIVFEYNDRGNYIPFKQASEGQQAAALLNLLLRQEAGTLIIDQPEDDLDNKVIMSIVKLVQTTKRKRQLFLATHNPNFVVNGDADKVVALIPGSEADTAGVQTTNARIEIEVDGAIETPDVRKAITEVMEGGEKAFELRSRKYSFKYS
ncbi:MAG: AAA family ATPase [Proteobacteria bacterium]|nr:AAA family ATPase [Pseudomonadota bacterium]MDA1056364.1 AAA family ATPase [Pseudomonadota bacterium]